MVILLALVIGAGASYGYYVMSTPKVPVDASQPKSTPTSQPKSTPTSQPKSTQTTGEIPSIVASITHGRLTANVAYVFVDTANRALDLAWTD